MSESATVVSEGTVSLNRLKGGPSKMMTVSLSHYLFHRLRQVGIETIMGLPGDFNLEWLDALYEVPGLKWAGNANELNSAYAADGYARVKGVPGCIVTTHGVGELSAINGIAGSACEHVPIIHIVGQTPRAAQKNKLALHHNVGRYPDHQMYNKMASHVRAASADLWDIKTAPADVDRAIRTAFITKQPVYINFPIDMANEQVPSTLLDEQIDLSWPVNKTQEEAALEKVAEILYQAKSPCVFVDHLVRSFGFYETRAIADKLALPTYVSSMGKTVIDEDKPYYVGLYSGKSTEEGTAAIHESDLVLSLGWYEVDTNSCFFSRNIPATKRIDVLEDHVNILGQTFHGVYMAPFLQKLAHTLDPHRITHVHVPRAPRTNIPGPDSADGISQKYLWSRMGAFLKPGDVVHSETGTSSYGMLDATFPPDTRLISQVYYGSIGYSTASAFGTEMALREIYEADKSKPRRRTVLITGDGSMQLTIQEVGTMVARGLQPVIIIINNNGYTIEKAIHGARQKYNDVSSYNFAAMLALFGARTPAKQYRACRTRSEFEAAMMEPCIVDPTEVQVVEVHVDALDLPWRLAEVLSMRPGMGEYLAREGFNWRE